MRNTSRVPGVDTTPVTHRAIAFRTGAGRPLIGGYSKSFPCRLLGQEVQDRDLRARLSGSPTTRFWFASELCASANRRLRETQAATCGMMRTCRIAVRYLRGAALQATDESPVLTQGHASG